tara:strand:- start:640 stop:1734 length:1095 start_codon:yes stop_codon:yes gene_type:complete
MNNTKVNKTSLYESHIKLGAKLVPFAEYIMPVSYTEGIQSEYFSVRKDVGIFDVSHMGEFILSGSGAENFLQKMTINNVSKLNIGDAQYSAMCYPDGGIVDDLILYRTPTGYFMVVNASNIIKNFDWLNKHLDIDVNLKNVSNDYSLIAIQGPNSRATLKNFTNAKLDMPFYSYQDASIFNKKVMLSRTGYTGELGFEIYGNHESLVYIWKELINLGIKPAGLAARDVLRLEMKYCLYGNDINNKTNPLEAGLGWITDFSKKDFIGKDVLLDLKKSGIHRKLVPFILNERGIPRSGYEVFSESKQIGIVTSGTQSPTLKNGIGLAYVNKKYSTVGQKINLKIRDKFISGEVVRAPFIKNTSINN